MGDFFKSWQRKVGCVALVMACLLTTGWFRSYVKHDIAEFVMNGRQLVFYPANGTVLWQSWGLKGTAGRHRWRSMTLNSLDALESVYIGAVNRKNSAENRGFKVEEKSAAYWSLLLPLTLLSAYLILWKPRQATRAAKTPGQI